MVLQYTTTNNPRVATVIGDTGGATNTTTITIPSTVSLPTTNGFVTYTVTSIGAYAFDNYTNLTSVTIGNNVTSIGEGAFYNCDSLVSITIPSSVTSIGIGAFNQCDNLETVTFMGDIPTIGTNNFTAKAFDTAYYYQGAQNISRLSPTPAIFGRVLELSIEVAGIMYKFYESNATVTGTSAGYTGTTTVVTIPSTITYLGNTYNVTSIGESAFNNYINLTSVTLPSSVTTIGDSAFQSTNLTNIIIPDSVISIGSFVFSDCHNLESVTLPTNGSFNTINVGAFQTCFKLASIIIPSSVTSIGNSAFNQCSILTTVTFMGDIPTIGTSNFTQNTNDTAYYYPNVQNISRLSPTSAIFGSVRAILQAQDPPVISTVTGSNESAIINFTQNISESLNPITRFEYSIDNGLNWVSAGTTTTSPITATGLTRGASYDFILRNFNGLYSSDSNMSSATVSNIAVPSAPTIGTVTVSFARVTIAFTAGADNNSSISGYQYSKDNGSTWVSVGNGASTAFTVSTGLKNGLSYTFLVRAVNGIGPGASASTGLILIAGVPNAPIISSVTVSSGQAVIAFPAAVSNGSPITGYQLSKDNGLNWSDPADVRSISVNTGLTNGNYYTFLVRAVNGIGPGASVSSGSILVDVLPGAPTITGVTVSSSQAVIAFTGTNIGSQISGYQYSTNGGANWTPTISTTSTSIINMTSATSGSITITNLTNGTSYDFIVRAVNAIGAGAASNVFNKKVIPTLLELKNINAVKTTYTTYGYQLQDLVSSALHTLYDLKEKGYTLNDLKTPFTPNTLINSGLFNSTELKGEGLIESGITYFITIVASENAFSLNRMYSLNDTNEEIIKYIVLLYGEPHQTEVGRIPM